MTYLKKAYLQWSIIITTLLILGIGLSNFSSQTSVTQDDSNGVPLATLMQLASQGKSISSEFPVKTAVIDDVIKKWGEPENFDWIPEAKGSYAVYSKHNIVFGVNKGSQIFEIKSFDPQIKKTTLSEVKKVLGAPVYDVKANGQQILGYLSGEEFKVLFVFPESTIKNSSPSAIYYSVFYPRGTVNFMSEDPGREW